MGPRHRDFVIPVTPSPGPWSEEVMGDARSTWEVLGKVLGGGRKKRKRVACGFFRKDREVLTDKGEIAEGFCEFYSQVGPKLVAKIRRERDGTFLDNMGDRVEELLFWRPTTPHKVEELCGSLDPHKGIGYDEISQWVIQTVAHEISGPLSRLFNCCNRGGHYPSFFKVARIRSLFKSEDLTEFSNYRPISVFLVLSQVFERVLQVKLLELLDLQSVINPGRYGFRAGHSTAMAVQNMVERVRDAWDSMRSTLEVFIDLKNAFDMVDHGIFLAKVEHYEVRGEVFGLLWSYLESRCWGLSFFSSMSMI
jgi:hypothetical protein